MNQNPQNGYVRGFKIVVLGDSGTGKTAFLQRHINGVEQSRESIVGGLRIYPMEFQSNIGRYRFKCWDTLGWPQSNGLQDAFLTGSRGAIIMMDVTRIVTMRNVPTMFRAIRRVCGNIPIILCGNKVDMENKQVRATHLVRLLTRYPTIEYTEISALSNYNFSEPFLHFIKYYDAGEDMDLSFDPFPDLLPPEVEFDVEAQRQREESIELPPLNYPDDHF